MARLLSFLVVTFRIRMPASTMIATALSAGTRLGPYEIVALVGSGGMGEVYRAKDTRLERTVAIKVLNAALVATPDAKARFEREARTVSQLNHPHICTLFDVGHQNGADFLVMEFLEGEPLSERIKRGPLPLNDVLKFALQLADALERAHRAGIIHRDLKPGNIMITKAGANLLDFGLAKPVGASVAGVNGSSSSILGATLTATLTMTSPVQPLSSAGTIIGTVQYMAPEQVQGLEADARSDIFAFGVLLYEMLTGKRAFDGKTQASVIGAILAIDPPPVASLQPMAPADLGRLVQTCLHKDPDERFQTIHDVKLRLGEIAEAPPPRAPSTRRSRALWAIAASAALAPMALSVVYYRRPAAQVQPVQLWFLPPANLSFNDAVPDAAVISPDGQKLAFSATSPEGKWQLWVRRLDSAEVQLLPGSDDPLEPFWSPDSRSIAFGSQGKLKRVDLGGGGAQVLCDAARMTGGAWSNKGVIVFGSDYGSALYQVPATGGEPRPATAKEAGEADFGHTAPSFLPDGEHFLFRININANPRGVWIGSLHSLERKRLLSENTAAIYAPPGYVIFVRSGALMAQAFNASRLELEGEVTPIVSRGAASQTQGGGNGRISASDNSILVWQPNWSRECQLRWFDRTGKAIGAVGEPIEVNSGQEPHLSPDGKHLVLKRDNNIWVMDLIRGTGIRLTSTFSQLPHWTPDGSHIIYQSALDTNLQRRGVIRRAANGAGEAELLAEGVKFPHASSPDGRFILYLKRGEKTRLDVWVLPAFGDRQEYPLLNSAFDERDPEISRDGTWLAYTSDESGSYEVYARPFNDGKVGDDKRRISVNTGHQPVWNPNGQELFYVSEDGQLMSVAVRRSGAHVEFGAPKALFRTRMLAQFNISHEYDVTPDGQRFIMGTLVSAKPAPATVMLHWPEAVKREQ